MKNERLKTAIIEVRRVLRSLQLTRVPRNEVLDASNKKDYAHKVMSVSNAIKR